jgi:hypothetical protein
MAARVREPCEPDHWGRVSSRARWPRSDPTTVLARLPASLLLTAYATTFVILGSAMMRRRDMSA